MIEAPKIQPATKPLVISAPYIRLSDLPEEFFVEGGPWDLLSSIEEPPAVWRVFLEGYPGKRALVGGGATITGSTFKRIGDTLVSDAKSSVFLGSSYEVLQQGGESTKLSSVGDLSSLPSLMEEKKPPVKITMHVDTGHGILKSSKVSSPPSGMTMSPGTPKLGQVFFLGTDFVTFWGV